jgi:hypothetical protein
MSSSTNTRPSWREREATKYRQQREAAAKAIEDAQRKQYANTESNFPTTMARPMGNKTHVPQGFSTLASKWQEEKELEEKMEAYRKASSTRERQMILNDVYIYQRRRAGHQDEQNELYGDEEDYESTVDEPEQNLDEMFPPHGKRGTYTAPDAEGWRLVVRRTRKQPRMLTEAQLVQKYRDEFFGGDGEEDDDMNGDLAESNQRRQFY